MIPLCLDQGRLTPYSPLAKGRAARPWGEQTSRLSADAVAKAFDRDVDKPVIDAIHTVADNRGVPMAQVALAWVLSRRSLPARSLVPPSPSTWRMRSRHWPWDLTAEEIAALEEPYTAQDNYWW